MNSPFAAIHQRLEQYLESRQRRAIGQFGWGWDGVVIHSDADTAVKGFKFIELFRRERDIYLRLFEHDVREVQGFAVPEMLDFDEV